MMRPFSYSQRNGAVILQTSVDGVDGPDLVVDQDNTLILLGVTLLAIKQTDNAEMIEAAACSAKAQLGGRWFK